MTAGWRVVGVDLAEMDADFWWVPAMVDNHESCAVCPTEREVRARTVKCHKVFG